MFYILISEKGKVAHASWDGDKTLCGKKLPDPLHLVNPEKNRMCKKCGEEIEKLITNGKL